ncbi:MAG: TrbG/VirB9 family P-type conjugative transfer protein [Gemmatimonadetes bacterium]|nr:TrbG/VirB9 family P-type conjugative transfer protein [Gemmatimonadota bacterium]
MSKHLTYFAALALTLPATANAQAMDAAADPIAAATHEYRRTGTARPVKQGNSVAYPFGHSQPTLSCAVLRACIIELQQGEVVIGTIRGDTERWLLDQTFTGSDGRTVLLALKPTDCDLTSNLVVSTDRRVYHLTLDSPSCTRRGTNPALNYTRHVRFYYPDDMVTEMDQRHHLAGRQISIGPADATKLNFDYRWQRDRRYPWTPQQVFDDGVHTYIKLPPAARNADAPVLFSLRPDGGKDIVNYATRGDFYISDRVLQRAALVVGVGRNRAEQQLVIENRRRQ